MKTTILLGSLALAASATFLPARALVQPAPAGATSAAATYQVDPGHSGALFRITHLGVAPFYGRFNVIQGEYVLDQEDASNCRVNVKIDANSVDTNSADRDKHIKSPDFFNSKEFPWVEFTSKEVSGGDGEYRITGDLSFHGVTKEVTADATLVGIAETRMGPKSGFEVTFTIDRNDFEVKTYPGALGDEVKIILFVEGNEVSGADKR